MFVDQHVISTDHSTDAILSRTKPYCTEKDEFSTRNVLIHCPTHYVAAGLRLSSAAPMSDAWRGCDVEGCNSA